MNLKKERSANYTYLALSDFYYEPFLMDVYPEPVQIPGYTANKGEMFTTTYELPQNDRIKLVKIRKFEVFAEEQLEIHDFLKKHKVLRSILNGIPVCTPQIYKKEVLKEVKVIHVPIWSDIKNWYKARQTKKVTIKDWLKDSKPLKDNEDISYIFDEYQNMIKYS